MTTKDAGPPVSGVSMEDAGLDTGQRAIDQDSESESTLAPTRMNPLVLRSAQETEEEHEARRKRARLEEAEPRLEPAIDADEAAKRLQAEKLLEVQAAIIAVAKSQDAQTNILNEIKILTCINFNQSMESV